MRKQHLLIIHYFMELHFQPVLPRSYRISHTFLQSESQIHHCELSNQQHVFQSSLNKKRCLKGGLKNPWESGSILSKPQNPKLTSIPLYSSFVSIVIHITSYFTLQLKWSFPQRTLSGICIVYFTNQWKKNPVKKLPKTVIKMTSK